MSGIFGEMLTFGQENGPDVRLVVRGDEFYARHENLDGYTVVYDADLGLFCYATLIANHLVSSGIPIAEPAPNDLRRGLMEPEPIRQEKFEARQTASLPPPELGPVHETGRTFGPNQGLLAGRRVPIGRVLGLTILIEFQDVTSTVTSADVEELLNGTNYHANGNYCSVREYYDIMSSGKLDYSNVVVGPYKLSRKRMYYVNKLPVREALDLAVADGIDLTQFDSQGESIVDAINVMYAGRTQYLGELWPHNSYLSLQYGNMRTYFYQLTSMGSNSSQLSIGTFCHESGHLLCRFPDLYDYGNRDGDGVESAGIGVYCLMGAGNHLGSGRTPAPICAYLRDLAGWCDNVVLLNNAGNEVEARHGEYDTLLMFETNHSNEYFLIENRSKHGLDADLPSSGLAIYHCDILGSNEWQEGSSTRHYQCALLQADGHFDLEHNRNQGDGADLFGAVTGTALSYATTPSSRKWDRSDSGLIVSNISGPGQTIQFRVGEDPMARVVHGEVAPGSKIPDDKPEGVRSTIAIAEAGIVQQLKVSMDITHSYIGDLVVRLISPSGQEAVLHDRAGGSKDNLITTQDAGSNPELAKLIGGPVQGDWVLHVMDVARFDVGKLNHWSIDIGLEPVEQVICGEVTPELQIPDNDPVGVSSIIELDQQGMVRQLKVSVDITHTYIGDLRVTLISPTGREAILHGRLGGPTDNLVATYSSEPPSPLASLVGQPAQGRWILKVADLAGRDIGTLNKWSLELRIGG